MKSLIVFAKAPLEGKVKTRLAEKTPLTEVELCELYRSFLCDTLEISGKCEADKVILNFTPTESETLMREIAEQRIPTGKLILAPQLGENFSQRIAAAFDYAAGIGAKSAVMIGSDSPTLKSATINNAFNILNAQSGAVLGPSSEGGIYLIGLISGFRPDFEKIFGNGCELSSFAEELKKNKIQFTLLEEVTDVDVASDLVSLISLIDAMKAASIDFPQNSARAIEKFRLRVVQRNGTRDKVIIRGD